MKTKTYISLFLVVFLFSLTLLACQLADNSHATDETGGYCSNYDPQVHPHVTPQNGCQTVGERVQSTIKTTFARLP
jgi:hypothetical protein